MKLSAELSAYEVNGEEQSGLERPVVSVAAHWNRDDMVDIKTGDGKRYTVVAKDLVEAVRRCTGWR